MFKMLTVLMATLFAVSAQAQVLTTAETIGQGKQLVAVSENHLYEDGVDLNVAYVMYARGLTPRLDLYLAVGETHIFSQGQAWAGVGGNAKLFTVKKVSVSTFAMVSAPLHRLEDAATLLLNPAVVVSYPVASTLSFYSGVNILLPVGNNRKDKLFTPAGNKFNVPLGASLVLGPWSVTAEADAGKLKAVGIAVSRLF